MQLGETERSVDMGVGAIFLILVVLIVVTVLGFGLYGLIGRLTTARRHRSGDRTLVGPEPDRGDRRPEHTRVETEQPVRFGPSRG
jgi:hypothetical protein